MLDFYIKYGPIFSICFLLLGIAIMCIKYLRQNFKDVSEYCWWIETLTIIEWAFMMLFAIGIIVYIMAIILKRG